MASGIRVFYATSTDRAIHAARQMQLLHGWEPVYWLATVPSKAQISKLFDTVPIHDYLDSCKGVGLSSFASYADDGVDMEFVQSHARQISTAIYMLDRNDSFSRDMNVRARTEFIYRLIAYWTGVLGAVKPDLIAFEEEPHQASDYILYLIAKHVGIKMLMPIRTMPPWGFLLSTDYEEGPILLDPEPQSSDSMESSEALPEYITKYMYALRQDYAVAKRLMLWNQVGRISGRRPFRFVMELGTSAVRRARMWRRYVNNLRSFRTDHKERGKTLSQSEMPYYAFLARKAGIRRTKARNRATYESLATEPDLGVPFVYFALSYQPEKTTWPCGNEFAHQLLVVRTLAASLPAGWNLLVKEHPSQFNPIHARYAENFRDAEYYRSIVGFESTFLVPMASNPYDLMDKAAAVATVGGSSSFEAAVRGHQGLLFGHAWYVDCPGVTRASTVEQVQSALFAPEPDPESREQALVRYLEAVGRSLYRAPTSISDESLFEPNQGLDEYVRFYKEYHERFLTEVHVTQSEDS